MLIFDGAKISKLRTLFDFPLSGICSPHSSGTMGSTELYGRALRKAHFLFEEDYYPLNHGSFGSYPKSVSDRMHQLEAQAESHPDTYIRYEFPELLEKSRKVVAKLLNAKPSTIVFVPNATTAGNTILRALAWEHGDVILTCETSIAIIQPSTYKTTSC